MSRQIKRHGGEQNSQKHINLTPVKIVYVLKMSVWFSHDS